MRMLIFVVAFVFATSLVAMRPAIARHEVYTHCITHGDKIVRFNSVTGEYRVLRCGQTPSVHGFAQHVAKKGMLILFDAQITHRFALTVSANTLRGEAQLIDASGKMKIKGTALPGQPCACGE